MRLTGGAEDPVGRRRLYRFILFLLLLAAGLFAVIRPDREKPASSSSVRIPSGPTFSLPSTGGPTGYVASASCRECHPRQHDSWHRTYHRTMTQIMTTNSVLADFNNVSLETRGERFILNRQGNNFSATIIDLDELSAPEANSNQPIEAVRIPMGLVTGSHHMQVFWLPSGAGNMQIGFPFTWLIQDQRWVPRNDAFLRDPNSVPGKEIWNFTCIRCHATAGEPRPDQAQHLFDTRVAEFGVACEACHGPGLAHVQFERTAENLGRTNLAPIPRVARSQGQPQADRLPETAQRTLPDLQKRESETGAKLAAAEARIVQPRDLDHIRSSQVCGSCHSIKWFDDTEGWKEHGFRFRPGDDLEKTTPIVRPKKLDSQPWLQKVLAKHPDLFQDFFWPDGMIRVAGREYNGLVESPCFQRGKVSCLSCHSMHQSDPNDQLARGMDGNQACLQCHQKFERDLTAHTHHLAQSAGSQCYNCHMPHTSYGLLKSIRSHQIDSPNVTTTLATGRPNACNLCHLDQTLQWTAQRLTAWYGLREPELGQAQRQVAAGILWMQGGDAGQRALAAWSAGWSPALQASGPQWQAPHLADILNDPYSAVRYIAHRSLQQLPGFTNFQFDFVGSPTEREQARARAQAQAQALATSLSGEEAARLLLKPDGTLDVNATARVQAERNNRPMRLRE